MVTLTEYEVAFVPVNSPQHIRIKGNSIIFINKGTSIAKVKGLQLYPEQSLEITGNHAEIDTTNYDIDFTQAAGEVNNLWVIQKIYRGL